LKLALQFLALLDICMKRYEIFAVSKVAFSKVIRFLKKPPLINPSFFAGTEIALSKTWVLQSLRGARMITNRKMPDCIAGYRIIRSHLVACLMLLSASAMPMVAEDANALKTYTPQELAWQTLDPEKSSKDTFILRITTPEDGAKVIIKDRSIGVTPLEMVLPCVPFEVKIQHPYYNPVVLRIDPQPGKILSLSPEMSVNSMAAKLGLQKEEGSLILEKRALQKKYSKVYIINAISWAVCGVGAAGVGYLYSQKGQFVNAYNIAATQSAMNAAQSNINLYNTGFTVALGVGGAGLLSSIITMILEPNIPAKDRQIKDLDAKISNLSKE
jgi:hypothetical protein